MEGAQQGGAALPLPPREDAGAATDVGDDDEDDEFEEASSSSSGSGGDSDADADGDADGRRNALEIPPEDAAGPLLAAAVASGGILRWGEPGGAGGLAMDVDAPVPPTGPPRRRHGPCPPPQRLRAPRR